MVRRPGLCVTRVVEFDGLAHGVRGEVGDAAVVHAPDYAIVAVLAPHVAPGVLDDPVVEAVLLAVSDEERVDVERVRVAVLVLVDGAGLAVALVGGAAHDAVDVEVHALGVHGYGDGPIAEERELEQVLVARAHGDHLPRADARDGAALQRRVQRRLVAGRRAVGRLRGHVHVRVRVVRVEREAAEGFDVLEGFEGVAAEAAVVERVAGDQLLGAEARERVVRREELRTLDVAGRGKGPGRRAVARVLDVRDGAEGAPVELRRLVRRRVVAELPDLGPAELVVRVGLAARDARVLGHPADLAPGHAAPRRRAVIRAAVEAGIVVVARNVKTGRNACGLHKS